MNNVAMIRLLMAGGMSIRAINNELKKACDLLRPAPPLPSLALEGEEYEKALREWQVKNRRYNSDIQAARKARLVEMLDKC